PTYSGLPYLWPRFSSAVRVCEPQASRLAGRSAALSRRPQYGWDSAASELSRIRSERPVLRRIADSGDETRPGGGTRLVHGGRADAAPTHACATRGLGSVGWCGEETPK